MFVVQQPDGTFAFLSAMWAKAEEVLDRLRKHFTTCTLNELEAPLELQPDEIKPFLTSITYWFATGYIGQPDGPVTFLEWSEDKQEFDTVVAMPPEEVAADLLAKHTSVANKKQLLISLGKIQRQKRPCDA